MTKTQNKHIKRVIQCKVSQASPPATQFPSLKTKLFLGLFIYLKKNQLYWGIINLEQNELSLTVLFDESRHTNKPVKGAPQITKKNFLIQKYLHNFTRFPFAPSQLIPTPRTSGYWLKTDIHPSRDIYCKFKDSYTLKNIFLFSFFQRGTTFCRRLCISDLTVFVNSIFWLSHFLLL